MKPEHLLQEIYVEPNLTYAMVADRFRERFEHSLAAVRGGLEVPAFLPTRKAADGSASWYGVIASHRDFDELLEVARAAIDPSLGAVVTSAESDGPRSAVERLVEDVLVESIGRNWLRIDVPKARVTEARNALERQVASLLRRPAVEFRIRRTLERIRSDLDLAVAEKDITGVERLLAELQDVPTLTAENRAFVRIDALSRLALHTAVLEMTNLGRMMESRPPRRVRLAVLDSLAAVLGLPAVAPPSPAWSDLPSGTKELLATALEVAPPLGNATQAQLLLLAYQETDAAPAGPWAEVPALLTELDAASGSSEEWRAAFASPEQVDLAPASPLQVLQTLADAAASVAEVRRVVGDAITLGTPEAARIASACVDSATQGVRRDPVIAGALRGLSSLTSGDVLELNGWLDWVDRCSTDEDWLEARVAAEEGSARWSLDGDALEGFAECLTSANEPTARNIRSGLGLAMQALGELRTSRDGTEVVLASVELLALVPPTSHDERQALLTWTEELLRHGLDPSGYVRLVEALETVWQAAASRGTADWAVDVLAILGGWPDPGSAASEMRLQFFWSVVADLAGWATTLPSVMIDAVETVADMIGADLDGALPARSKPTLAALADRRVGVHTLMVSAAQTVTARIAREAPSCVVDVNDDHVATERLIALAQRADIFLLVTAACKHEASSAVETHRPVEKPLLRVNSKGATAMLQALWSYLETPTELV